MNAYAEMVNLSWQTTVLTCAFASLGDAAITAVVYSIVAIAVQLEVGRGTRV